MTENHEAAAGQATAAADTLSSANGMDVVDVVTSDGGYRLHGNAKAVLDEIQPPTEQKRFLQSWDAGSRVLAFGFGDGNKGVTVASNADVREVTTGVLPSRFRKETYQRVASAMPISTSDLLARIGATFARYLHFDDKPIGTLVSLWTLGAYVYTLFGHYGYLHLFSNQPRSGKTRALELIHHLAFEPSKPLNAPTPAVMREVAAEGGTVLFDTLERWRDKSQEAYSAAMDMLDAGFRNGGTVSKMVPVEKSGWRKESYSVYAPYALAGIHRESLSETALDRSFPIHMRRKPVKLRKHPYRFDKCAAECAPIREDSYVWALQNAERLASIYEGTALDRQVQQLGLNDRAADIWKPLFAIATLGDIEPTMLAGLEAWAQQTGGDAEIAEDARRLRIASALAAELAGWPDGRFVGMTSEVIVLLDAHGVTVADSDLHRLLDEWGFTHKSTRIGGGHPRRAWHLDASALRQVEHTIRGAMQPCDPLAGDYSDYSAERT